MSRYFVLLTILIFTTFIFYKRLFHTPPSSPQKVVVILQSIDHDTLNTVRQSLTRRIQEIMPEIVLVYENAHGNMATLQQIAHKFAALSPKVMVGMGTQASQILLPFAKDKNIPLVFTAVTDPSSAKLTGYSFVTGVSDFMPAAPQLEFFKTLMPSLKKLGVLYNPSEVNSVGYLEFVKIAANHLGIELLLSPLYSTNEAKTATERLAGKVDALYFPNDNTAMAAVGAIVAEAKKHNLPVFANDSASVEKGASAALAYDRMEMGKDTGDIIISILKGKTPYTIAIKKDGKLQPVVNPSFKWREG